MELKDLYELKNGDEPQSINFGTFVVTVKRRADDWWACLNGNHGKWCCGDSLDYVVGYMALTWYSEQEQGK